MRGHLNVKPISRMLVDGGAIVNLMPYSLYKKLGGKDEELIKTNMTVSGVGGGDCWRSLSTPFVTCLSLIMA